MHTLSRMLWTNYNVAEALVDPRSEYLDTGGGLIALDVTCSCGASARISILGTVADTISGAEAWAAGHAK